MNYSKPNIGIQLSIISAFAFFLFFFAGNARDYHFQDFPIARNTGGAIHNILEDRFLEDRYKKYSLVMQVKSNVSLIHQHMRDAAAADNIEDVKSAEMAIDAIRESNRALLNEFDKIVTLPQSRELFNRIVEENSNDLDMQKRLFVLLMDGKQKEGKAFLNAKMMQMESSYVGKLNEMVLAQSGKMNEESQIPEVEFTRIW